MSTATVLLKHLVPALGAALRELEAAGEEKPMLRLDPPRMMGISEAAEYLGVSHSTVCRALAAGEIPHRRFGQRNYVISERALREWVEGAPRAG